MDNRKIETSGPCGLTREESLLLKGIAIIMMVSGHLFTMSWINEPERIIDFQLWEWPIFAVIADAANFCVAIFAFITGYGFARGGGFWRKKKSERILRICLSYWLTLFLINIPCLMVSSYLETGFWCPFSGKDIVLSVLAVTSKLSNFNWYILFYVAAILTYPFFYKILIKVNMKPLVKMGICVLVFMAARLCFRLIFNGGYISKEVLNFTSHYCITMPSLLIGSIANEDNLFVRTDKFFEGLRIKKKPGCVCVLMIIIIVETVMHNVINLTSSIDFIWIFLVVYSLRNLLRINLIRESCSKLLIFLGKNSLYIWLIHAVFLLDYFQRATYAVRIPVLVVCIVLLISVPVSWVIGMVDGFAWNKMKTRKYDV